MLTPLERVNNLLADLRFAQVDFDALYAGKNSLTPLESVELFLAEQQRLRILKQNLLRRKRAISPLKKRWSPLTSASSAVFPGSRCSACPT